MAQSQLVKFNFKSRTIRDEAGNAVAKGKKQPSIEVAIPLLTSEDICYYLQAEDKQKEAVLITEAVAAIMISQAREQFDEMIESFGDDQTKEVTADALDFSKLTLEYIASIPPTQRGATAISEEEYVAFFTDYMAVMVAATGKNEARIQNHINFFKRPQKVRNNKEVLGGLVQQLDIYMTSSNALEDTGPVASRIRDKFDRWAKEPEKAITLDLL